MNKRFAITKTLLLSLGAVGGSEAMPGGPFTNPIRCDASLIQDHQRRTGHAFHADKANLNIDDRSYPMSQEEWEVTFHWGKNTPMKLDFEVNFDEDSLEPSGARLGPVLLDKENALALLRVLSGRA